MISLLSVIDRPPPLPPTRRLRDYQSELLDRVEDEFETHRSVLMQLPTGAGKTVTFGEIIRRKWVAGAKVALVAHRHELLQQANAVIPARFDTFTVQSLAHDPYALSGYDFVVIDECHRAAASSYANAVKDVPKVLGVSATPYRHSKGELATVFDTLVQGVSVAELIERGYLCDYDYWTKSGGSVSPERAYFEMCEKYGKRVRVIAYFTTVEEAARHAGLFNAAGIKSAMVEGNTPGEVRRDVLERMNSGDLDIVTNVELYTEGIDVPSIDGVFFCNNNKSPVKLLQMFGRALRPAEGKSRAFACDFSFQYENVRFKSAGQKHVIVEPKTPVTWSLKEPPKKTAPAGNLGLGIGTSPGTPRSLAHLEDGNGVLESVEERRRRDERRQAKSHGEFIMSLPEPARLAYISMTDEGREVVRKGVISGYKPGWFGFAAVTAPISRSEAELIIEYFGKYRGRVEDAFDWYYDNADYPTAWECESWEYELPPRVADSLFDKFTNADDILDSEIADEWWEERERYGV